jgi:protein-arginine kinase activator protein McsA
MQNSQDKKKKKQGGPKPISLIGCLKCNSHFTEIKEAVEFICKKCGHSIQDSFIEIERKLWQEQG